MGAKMPDGFIENMEQARLQAANYLRHLVQLVVDNRPRTLLGWAAWVAVGLAAGTITTAAAAALAFLGAVSAVVMLTIIPLAGLVMSAVLAGAACFSCMLTMCALAMFCTLWACNLGGRLLLNILHILMPDMHARLVHYLQGCNISFLLTILKHHVLPFVPDAKQQPSQDGDMCDETAQASDATSTESVKSDRHHTVARGFNSSEQTGRCTQQVLQTGVLDRLTIGPTSIAACGPITETCELTNTLQHAADCLQGQPDKSDIGAAAECSREAAVNHTAIHGVDFTASRLQQAGLELPATVLRQQSSMQVQAAADAHSQGHDGCTSVLHSACLSTTVQA